MAAMAFDNVIRFPDGARTAGAGPDRARTLKDARDLLAQKLREALRTLLASLGEEFMAKGDVADERDLRSHFYGAKDALQNHGGRLEAVMAAHWLRGFDEAVRGAEKKPKPAGGSLLDDLQLVEFNEMDEDLATKAICSRLRDGCEDELFAAGRRLAFLAGRDDDSLPVDELLAQSLRAALRAALDGVRDGPGPAGFDHPSVQGLDPAGRLLDRIDGTHHRLECVGRQRAGEVTAAGHIGEMDVRIVRGARIVGGGGEALRTDRCAAELGRDHR